MIRFTKLPADLPFRSPVALLATGFGAGLLPGAPGSWASAAALPFAWAIHAAFGRVGLLVAVVVVFALGVWAAGRFAERAGGGDPRQIVIDEVAGQWLVLVPAQPDLALYAAGFLLFRLADILKPWPVSWADRALPGGLGIMLDDILAAVYAGAMLYAIIQWSYP